MRAKCRLLTAFRQSGHVVCARCEQGGSFVRKWLQPDCRSRGVPKGGGLGDETPPKLRSFAKADPNSQFCGIYIRNNQIRMWVSFICKLSGTPD
jgi:hypothetical protein